MANRIRMGTEAFGYLDVTFTAEEIPTDAFYGCTTISEIETDVEEIPDGFAQYSDKAILKIKLPNVTHIGNALAGCENLEELELGSSTVPYVYANSNLENFEICTKLTKITIYTTESADGYDELMNQIIFIYEKQTDCQLKVYVDGVECGYYPATISPVN